jgi:hypothetical protein
VFVEGLLVIESLDIISIAPGKNVPYIVSLNNTFVTDGTITIDFKNKTGDPQINGIEILPQNYQTTAPVAAPISIPIKSPTKIPTKFPTRPPTKSPTKVPTKSPSKTPTKAPTNVPSKSPTKSPTKVPSNIPTKIPTKVPTKAPTAMPVPVPVPVTVTTLYRINCGSTSSAVVMMNDNTTWNKDQYSVSGAVYNTCTVNNISNSIYCSSRYFKTTKGTPFRYNLPIPYNNGTYQLRLHYAEQVNDTFDFLLIFKKSA